jgi:hypothetical protein
MWRCVDFALTDVSKQHIASIFMAEKSASGESAWAGRWLHTEPPVWNNQLYKNRERESRPHGKWTERRGVGSVVKVKPAGSRGRSISSRGLVGGGQKIQGYWVSTDPVATGLEMASMHWPSQPCSLVDLASCSGGFLREQMRLNCPDKWSLIQNLELLGDLLTLTVTWSVLLCFIIV